MPFPQGNLFFLDSGLKTRQEPLICVGFESHAFARESLHPLSPSKPRRPVDALGLPRSPFRKRADTPHLAGLDASASRQCCLPSQPARSVPAVRRPPLAEDEMVVALGVTTKGDKVFLGFVQTDTENAVVIRSFLRSLKE